MFLNLATVLMVEENTHSPSLTPHEVVMISGSQVLLFLPESTYLGCPLLLLISVQVSFRHQGFKS